MEMIAGDPQLWDVRLTFTFTILHDPKNLMLWKLTCTLALYGLATFLVSTVGRLDTYWWLLACEGMDPKVFRAPIPLLVPIPLFNA